MTKQSLLEFQNACDHTGFPLTPAKHSRVSEKNRTKHDIAFCRFLKTPE